MAQENPSISDFYNDRSVFVTGATGFMGKVLIEKLLWSCHGIKTIYVLLRSKKDKTPSQRFKELLQSQVFGRLKEKKPKALLKLVLIEGDVLQPGLGISESDDLLLINNISVVFHYAATTEFNEKLKPAVQINVLGTQRVIELCHKMKKLEALVYISTGYSNCDRKHIDEIVYEPQYSPDKIIDVVGWMIEKFLDPVTTVLLKGKPNTYTYSKALAETLLLDASGSLPVAIVRPTILMPSWKEPFPGWVDNLNGLVGLSFAIAKGALRTLLCDTSLVGDLMPVDVATNNIIAVAWNTALQKQWSNNISVYNCSSRSTNPITWQTVQRYANLLAVTFPMSEVFSYPHCIFTKWKKWNKMIAVFYHYIPAYLYDFYNVLRSQNTVAVSQYNKLHTALLQLQEFTTREWTFDTTNVLKLYQKLGPKDKKEFNFDIQSVDWPIYCIRSAYGARKYLAKEEPSTIPSAKKKLKRLYLYTTLWQTFLWIILFLMMLSVYKVIKYLFLSI